MGSDSPGGANEQPRSTDVLSQRVKVCVSSMVSQIWSSSPVDLKSVPLGVLLHTQSVVQLLLARGHRLQLLVITRLLCMREALLLRSQHTHWCCCLSLCSPSSLLRLKMNAMCAFERLLHLQDGHH